MSTDATRLPVDRSVWLAVMEAYGRALWTRAPLPPGDLGSAGSALPARAALAELARRYGPVFKLRAAGRLVVCVVGAAPVQRLLDAHAASLAAIDGAAATGSGDGARCAVDDASGACRRALEQALRSLDVAALAPRFEAIVAEALAAHRARHAAGTWTETLARIAANALIALLLGPEPGSAAHARLAAAYRRLASHAADSTTGHAEALRALSEEVAALDAQAGGLLAQLKAQRAADEATLRNLACMVATGRGPLRDLLDRVSQRAAEHGEWLERIAADAAAAEPFVLETVRLAERDALLCEARHDIVFDGWLIPRGAHVCLGHAGANDGDATFDPARCAERGARPLLAVDPLRCPVGAASIPIAAAFLRVLARGYRIVPADAARSDAGLDLAPAPRRGR